MEEIHRSKHIYTILTIVSPHLDLWTIEVITQVALVSQRQVETQSIALQLSRTNAHHGSYLGIVLGTGVVDDLHVADVLAVQTLQFAGIAHLPSINIYKRWTLAQHLWRFVSTCHARHLDEHLAQRARLSQRCALNAGNHRTSLQTGVGEAAFDDDLLQRHQLVYRFYRVLRLLRLHRHCPKHCNHQCCHPKNNSFHLKPKIRSTLV